MQLYDLAGAAEATWGASYKLLAEAVSAADGRAALPSMQLPPGRYLLSLQLLPAASTQWVDPASGATEPPPHWQLLCLPSLDEKV